MVPGKTTDSVRFLFDAKFKNATAHELAAVYVRMVAELSGRRAYVSPPQRLTRFQNVTTPHTGSLLPLNKSEFVRGIALEVPSRLWRTDTHRFLEVVGADGFVNPNLHDAGHLYTRLVNGTDEEQIPLFKNDSSLLKVKSPEGLTPLLMAFETCGPKMIRFLLSHGANPKDRTKAGVTIMHMAATNPNSGVQNLALTLDRNVNGRTIGGKTPIFRSILGHRPTCLKWLLQHGADPKAEDKGGNTPAKYAVREGDKECLTLLSVAGVGPRSKDKLGLGWLHYAVFNYLMMDHIVRLGVPIDDRNPISGETPLMEAAWAGWLEPQVWLLQHGANPNLKDKKGRTAYDYSGTYTYDLMMSNYKARGLKPGAIALRRMEQSRHTARNYFANLVRQCAAKR